MTELRSNNEQVVVAKKRDRSASSRKYYLKNKAAILERTTRNRKNNPERQREYARKSYLKHREKNIERVKVWQKKNEDHLREKRKNNAQKRRDRYLNYYKYDKGYIDKKREWKRRELSENPIFRLKTRIRNRHYTVLRSKGLKKITKTTNMLGCSVGFLRDYLASKFTEGMTWDNHGPNGWHIDHIKPLAIAASLEELEQLCHYTNLQPLWATDNLKKGKKTKQWSLEN